MARGKISGLTPYQTGKLNKMIRELPRGNTPKDEYSVAFEVPVKLRRQDSMWFGGTSAEIQYKGFVFSIEANGEIEASLHYISDDALIKIFRDKANDGLLGSNLAPYITTDNALLRATSGEDKKYRFDVALGNWWEIFILGKNKEWHPDSWVAEEDGLLAVIVETLRKMDKYIDRLNEREV